MPFQTHIGQSRSRRLRISLLISILQLLYQDFERLKGALSDEGFAKIRAKKGM
jgi:hypothetical protein